MKILTRREFLQFLVKSTGTAFVMDFLAACGIKPANVPETPTNTPFSPAGIDATNTNASPDQFTVADTSAPPTDTPTQTPAPATETPTPTQSPAHLAVAFGGDDPGALTRAAISTIGGMSRFVANGADVIIKPNVCTANRDYIYAATTNPWVVGELVKLCLEAGAGRVRVFDYPINGASQDQYQNSGIAEQVLANGGELEKWSEKNYVSVQLPGNVSLQQAYFYQPILGADLVIDVPIAKQHGTTGLTLAMKNLMGVVYNRGAMHNGNIHRGIAELANYIRPKLTVVDAVRILLAGGPTGGNKNDVKKMDTVIASADIVAADAYATRLFDWTDPNDLGYVRFGAELGLGRSDLDNLDIRDINVGS
jgi:uncharacterized protein (DUF362 family)